MRDLIIRLFNFLFWAWVFLTPIIIGIVLVISLFKFFGGPR